MKNFFLLLTLLVLPFSAVATELRSGEMNKKSPSVFQSKARAQNVVGTFPASPVYATVLTYDGTTCGTLFSASNFITIACLSTGSTSMKYTCSKSFFINVSERIFFFNN
jgi:hypothetical protein